MSIFDRLDRLTSRAVDRVNATAFTIIPMDATPNGRPGQDTTRSKITGEGIFDYLSVEFGVQLGVRKSYREGNDMRTTNVGRDPRLSFDRRYLPTGLDNVRQGDVVTFPDKPDIPDFDVIAVEADGLSRVELVLVHRGVQE